jgi:hypothetical protein
VRGTDLGVEVQQLARAAYHQSHRFPVIAETGLPGPSNGRSV